MSFHRPILPGKAIELVESRNLDAPEKLLADYAAAGPIKTYALMREIRPAGGPTKAVREPPIPQKECGSHRRIRQYHGSFERWHSSA